MDNSEKELYDESYGENYLTVFNSANLTAYLIFRNDKYTLRTVDSADGRRNFQDITLCKRDFFNLLTGIAKNLLTQSITIAANKIRKITD